MGGIKYGYKPHPNSDIAYLTPWDLTSDYTRRYLKENRKEKETHNVVTMIQIWTPILNKGNRSPHLMRPGVKMTHEQSEEVRVSEL